MELSRYKKYRAEIRVKDRSTLKPDCLMVDGTVINTMPLWIIEDGPFKGQWAMELPEETKYTWCPEEDLRIIEAIS